LLRRLLLLLLHLLHHLLLEQSRAAGNDLLDPDLERQRAVPGEIGRRRARAECQPLRHGETVLAAFLHPAHRLGEAGEHLFHRERLRPAMAFAAVEHRAVVGGEDIIHQRRIGASDRRALAGLDGPELKTARGHRRTQRTGADPGKADSGRDDDEEADP